MEDRDIEIEKLKKELANVKKDPRELILASRIREREEEYQHRLLELELASEGIIPVGIAPEAKAHGGKEFTALVKEVEVDEIFPVAEKVHKDGYEIIQDFLTKDQLEMVRKKMAPFFERTATLFKASDNDRHEGKQTTPTIVLSHAQQRQQLHILQDYLPNLLSLKMNTIGSVS